MAELESVALPSFNLCRQINCSFTHCYKISMYLIILILPFFLEMGYDIRYIMDIFDPYFSTDNEKIYVVGVININFLFWIGIMIYSENISKIENVYPSIMIGSLIISIMIIFGSHFIGQKILDNVFNVKSFMTAQTFFCGFMFFCTIGIIISIIYFILLKLM